MAAGIKTSLRAGAIIEYQRRVVLVRSSDPATPDDWVFPKGHIEEGETPLQAAMREAYEECGVMGISIVESPGRYISSHWAVSKEKKIIDPSTGIETIIQTEPELVLTHWFPIKAVEVVPSPEKREVRFVYGCEVDELIKYPSMLKVFGLMKFFLNIDMMPYKHDIYGLETLTQYEGESPNNGLGGSVSGLVHGIEEKE